MYGFWDKRNREQEKLYLSMEILNYKNKYKVSMFKREKTKNFHKTE